MPTVETNGFETYYERHGEGPPIIFVHGIMLDQNVWKPQEVLADQGYRVVSYDVRGHGRTGGTDASSYSIDLFADDLADLISSLGDEPRPILCGHSMGGSIAVTCAANNPTKVRGVVTTGFVEDDNDSNLRNAIKVRLYQGMVATIGKRRTNRVIGTIMGYRSIGDELDEWHLAGEKVTDEEYGKLRSLDLDADAVPVSQLKVPALFMAGENEAGSPVPLADQVPNAEADTIPDAGHIAQQSNPEYFNARLLEFVESVS